MMTLADKSLILGGDNKPPMLKKHLYDSWKSRMELYMLNRPHGRMILASVEKGPLVWPSITVDGATRLKEYIELTPAEAIQADCDIKAINIILQGLPTEIYALVSQHRVAKDLWEKIKLLMQGTSLTKQERECKLYDEFDKFTYKKGESLHEYYLRFTLLLNDMNIYKMPLEQFQVNTKFLNTLPDEWSKFVTDVKLVKDLHTTNVDQLHAYLQQHERHANEVRLMHERNSDPLALVASHQLPPSTYQSHLHTLPNSQLQHHVSPYPSSQFVTPYQTQQFTTSQSTPLSITYLCESVTCLEAQTKIDLKTCRGDNKPPMLEKHLYDSWKSRMELYMMNRPHGRMILASVEKGPLVWPSITEDGVTRLKEYVELTPAEAIQADCDIKAINIILQGLPTEIYALLYDEFDKFTYKKGETLHEYYLRFTLLLNDMNIYKMPLEQFQVNTNFLNTLPDEWSKFDTDVKLVKDLHTTNVDQLHAYLQQHERYANEVRLMHERNSDPLALVASHQLTQPAYQFHLHTHPKSLS
ncbi:hypothetical protein Tco_0670799 [Tanacetum coccineum]